MGIVILLLVGAVIGLIVGVALSIRRSDIQSFEIFVWSRQLFTKFTHLRNGLLVGLGLMFINIIVTFQFHATIYGLAIVLVSALASMIGGWLFSVLIDVLPGDIVDERFRILPNQGIHRSARNSILFGLLVGITASLLVGLEVGLIYWLSNINQGVTVVGATFLGIVTGLGIGIIGWLLRGGDVYLKHFMLRLQLRLGGRMPWNYVRFLDYAAEHILLRKVGGGYIFVHRLLLEYFATLGTSKSDPE